MKPGAGRVSEILCDDATPRPCLRPQFNHSGDAGGSFSSIGIQNENEDEESFLPGCGRGQLQAQEADA